MHVDFDEVILRLADEAFAEVVLGGCISDCWDHEPPPSCGLSVRKRLQLVFNIHHLRQSRTDGTLHLIDETTHNNGNIDGKGT